MKLFFKHLFILISLYACNSENKKNEKDILGKWIFVKEHFIDTYDKDGNAIPPPPPKEKLGYNFFSKDSCESNVQYFLIDFEGESDQNFILERDVRKNLSRKTIYKMENDSLKIFDRTFNRWDSFYIMQLDSHNLVLNKQNRVIQQFGRNKKE